jgi:hypothetical protein
MSHIMDPLEETDLRLMRAVFPEAPTGGIEAIEGKVDLLMGQGQGGGCSAIPEPLRNRVDCFRGTTRPEEPEACEWSGCQRGNDS